MTLKPHQLRAKVQIDEAIFLLNSGIPVAIPTETVYGLAARLDSQSGLKKIFEIKSRPFFDPLIVHVASLSQAKSLVINWGPIAECLAQSFWPGPLTLVLEKSSLVSDLVSSGLSTVGIRLPKHSVTLEILENCGPLAAPSANKFGKTSPTSADHILHEYDGKLQVVDGGLCSIGIESTILSIQDPQKLCILRPGMISVSDISNCLSQASLAFEWIEKTSIQSPGNLKHHYMPNVPLIVSLKPRSNKEMASYYLNCLDSLPSTVEGVTIHKTTHVSRIKRLTLANNPQLAARELYGALRSLSVESDLIALEWPYDTNDPEWVPIWDRVKKAATLIF